MLKDSKEPAEPVTISAILYSALTLPLTGALILLVGLGQHNMYVKWFLPSLVFGIVAGLVGYMYGVQADIWQIALWQAILLAYLFPLVWNYLLFGWLIPSPWGGFGLMCPDTRMVFWVSLSHTLASALPTVVVTIAVLAMLIHQGMLALATLL